MQKKKKELAQRRSKKWANLYKNDPRELWRLIDWKGNCNAKREYIPSDVTQSFFRKVFLSGKIVNNPTLESINNIVKNYQKYVDITDHRYLQLR